MKRVHLLFAILVVLAVVGYGPVMSRLPNALGLPSAERLTCEYAGRSYGAGEQRRAEDGCNICACGEHGWSCTEIACVPGGPGVGMVTGTLAYPSEVLPAQRVCAVDLATDKEYCRHAAEGEAAFTIAAPAGEYWVYAVLPDDASGKRAYYSEFVRCGLSTECKDHTPVTVVVEAGTDAEAHPHDWYAPGQFDGIVVAPSRYEYNTHNYYPTSSFQVRARGLSTVEFLSTPYPPAEAAVFAPIGAAALVSEERGIQTWSLPVPDGFQAMRVRARGESEGGAFLMSRELRVVRPIVTAAASSTVR